MTLIKGLAWIRSAKAKGFGLIISERGIEDNSNATSVGLIEWGDIEGIESMEVKNSRFLLIHTKDPQKYIGRIKGALAKKSAQLSMKLYGTPISLTSQTLKTSHAKMAEAVYEGFERWGKGNSLKRKT
jgi:hypothetical protein